jgi:hypothetical protein
VQIFGIWVPICVLILCIVGIIAESRSKGKQYWFESLLKEKLLRLRLQEYLNLIFDSPTTATKPLHDEWNEISWQLWDGLLIDNENINNWQMLRNKTYIESAEDKRHWDGTLRSRKGVWSHADLHSNSVDHYAEKDGTGKAPKSVLGVSGPGKLLWVWNWRQQKLLEE